MLALRYENDIERWFRCGQSVRCDYYLPNCTCIPPSPSPVVPEYAVDNFFIIFAASVFVSFVFVFSVLSCIFPGRRNNHCAKAIFHPSHTLCLRSVHRPVQISPSSHQTLPSPDMSEMITPQEEADYLILLRAEFPSLTFRSVTSALTMHNFEELITQNESDTNTVLIATRTAHTASFFDRESRREIESPVYIVDGMPVVVVSIFANTVHRYRSLAVNLRQMRKQYMPDPAPQEKQCLVCWDSEDKDLHRSLLCGHCAASTCLTCFDKLIDLYMIGRNSEGLRCTGCTLDSGTVEF